MMVSSKIVNYVLYLITLCIIVNFFIDVEAQRRFCDYIRKGKGKGIPVTDREGPQGCETSRLPHLLYNRLTDGGEVVSLMRRPSFTPRKIPGSPFSY
jgi:hypothetical protein